jgi:hypothetical protein
MPNKFAFLLERIFVIFIWLCDIREMVVLNCIFLFSKNPCIRKTENETKSQLAAHGDYYSIANCRIKYLPLYFEKYLEFLECCTKFINLFQGGIVVGKRCS